MRATFSPEFWRETGHVLAPASFPMRWRLKRARWQRPAFESSAVHGGDGTLHWTVTALLRAYGERPLPPLALLPGRHP